MKIVLYTDPIFREVRQKSHLGVADIKDPESRDNARAGVEKTDELVRCVYEGFAQLQRRCLRFLEEVISGEVDDAVEFPLPEKYTFVFNIAERRAIGKAEPLAAEMHAFVVQYALAKFNSTVNLIDQSNKYSLAAIDTGNKIDELLYHKQPPRV